MYKKIILVSILSIFWLPIVVQAADMYIILDKNEVAQNGTFSGTVYISTGGVAINNAEGTIHFPADLLSVDSINSSGSIFNIWVEQPTFSNTNGTVYFNGGLPTPGYSGQNGNSLRINFRTKKAGTAKISFGSSAVRADDGSGTDVLSQTRDSSIAITSLVPTPFVPIIPTVSPTPTVVPNTNQIGLPGTPVITSEDMPDQNSWYNETKGNFTWELPSSVNAVQLVLSQSPNSVPTVAYDPPIRNKILSNLPEGTSYINARFRNNIGWGNIASRKIKVDVTAPKNVSVETNITDDDLVIINASAEDSLSGVKSYSVYINGNKITEAVADTNGSAKFNLPPLSSGGQKLEIRAYDRAGNYTSAGVVVDVPELQVPKITHYPQSIKVGSSVDIRGKSPYLDGEIILWFQEDGEEAKSYIVKPDEDKIFSYTSDSINNVGVLNIWAETLRSTETKSSSASEKVYVRVKESAVINLGTNAIQIISIVITAALLLFFLVFIVHIGFKKLHFLRRKLRRDIVSTEKEVHKVFKLLKIDTRRHMRMLEKASTKRKLTKEESKILAELSENLDEAEAYLSQKVKVIKEPD